MPVRVKECGRYHNSAIMADIETSWAYTNFLLCLWLVYQTLWIINETFGAIDCDSGTWQQRWHTRVSHVPCWTVFFTRFQFFFFLENIYAIVVVPNRAFLVRFGLLPQTILSQSHRHVHSFVVVIYSIITLSIIIFLVAICKKKSTFMGEDHKKGVVQEHIHTKKRRK